MMMAIAGEPLGHTFIFLDPNPDSPAAPFGELVVAEYDDITALKRLASASDVVTYEFEQVPAAATRSLGQTPLHPPAVSLAVSQDRLTEKEFLQSVGVAVPGFQAVDSPGDAVRAGEDFGYPIVLKTRTGGYDGKGQVIIKDQDEVEDACESLGHANLIAEQHVQFDRELSVVAVRSVGGESRSYPLVANTHREGILRRTVAPAPGTSAELQATAAAYVTSVMERLDHVGALTLELFECAGGLLANEIAPRVHNSGHWTIEGAVCSQFENHVRAITQMPLGSTQPVGFSMMFNLIGGAPPTEMVLRQPGAHLHLYGKAPRPGRKIGHVTVTAEESTQLDRAKSELGSLIDSYSG